MRLQPAIIRSTKLLLGAICSLLIGLLTLGVLIFIFGMLQYSFWEKREIIYPRDTAARLLLFPSAEALIIMTTALPFALPAWLAVFLPCYIFIPASSRLWKTHDPDPIGCYRGDRGLLALFSVPTSHHGAARLQPEYRLLPDMAVALCGHRRRRNLFPPYFGNLPPSCAPFSADRFLGSGGVH